MRASLSIAVALLALSGCGPTFSLQLPERFVVLTDDPDLHEEQYDLRATTPDGVVVAVQQLDQHVDGSLTFWTEAVTRRLRDQQGYALLGEGELTAGSGEPGDVLRFGRDLEGHSYRYTVVLFVTESYIYVVEAGGREEAYAALEGEIERSVRAMRL